MTEYTLVLMRHGESEWNVANIFTGWVDVDLSKKGVEEGKSAGKLLKESGIEFDVAYTSLLKRAIKTCNIALEEAEQLEVPCLRSWRLNERMYGALEGMNKTECLEKHGEEQVLIWRRAFDTAPPEQEPTHKYLHSKERKYRSIDPQLIPKTEHLKSCIERVVPYWNNEIAPALKSGKTVLITAHGNSLRALVKFLDNISNNEILKLNIPTGTPLVYKLDENLKPKSVNGSPFAPLSGCYLGDVEEVKQRIEGVANQAKKK